MLTGLPAVLTGLTAVGWRAGSTVTTNPDPATVSPGFAGFLVTFLLAVAVILLVRSMTKHLRKVRYSPDPAASGEESDPGQFPDHRQGARNVVDDQGVDPRLD